MMNVLIWIMLLFVIPYAIMIMKGPTIWDRFLGVNLLLSKTIIIIIIFSSMHKTAYLLDFAIVYVLLAFVSAFFMARFIAGRIRKERKEKQ